MRISDWSSDVCSSDLEAACGVFTKCVELRHARDQYGVVRAANLDVIGSAAWAFAEFVEVEPDHAVECAARMNDAVVNAQILRAATVAVRDCSEQPLQIGLRGLVAGMPINVGVREGPAPFVDTAVDVHRVGSAACGEK